KYALISIAGLVVFGLFNLGYFRPTFLFLIRALFASTFLVPLCTQYRHPLLCQALAISRGCLFGPTPAVAAHWFEVKRSISMAMIVIGSSLGGTTMPIHSRNLLPEVVRGLGNLPTRKFLPTGNVPGGLFNWKVLKPAPSSVYCGSCCVTFLNGTPVRLTDISVSVPGIGISTDFSFYPWLSRM
ncbi:hypothetical protein BKA70DRAFT_1111376, partial [Coprinopsis sp. MPI-PUGE-AT-0042]